MTGHRKRSLRSMIIGGVAGLCSTGLWGQPGDEAIRLELSCRIVDDGADVRATMHNTGGSDTSIVLGIILENGEKYFASSLAVEVSVGREIIRFRNSDPAVPRAARRVDPWVVALPVSSEFVLTRSLMDFRADGQRLLDFVQRSDVQPELEARLVLRGASIPDFKVYSGEVLSDWVRIPGDCG